MIAIVMLMLMLMLLLMMIGFIDLGFVWHFNILVRQLVR